MPSVEFIQCDQCKEVVPSNRSTLKPNHNGAICTTCCATASRPPSVDLGDMMGQLTATPSTRPFIECLGVVQFDLQLGQVLEYVYPPLPFSVSQETEIAFLCFPDANHIGDGDSFHDFVYAFNGSEMDPRRATTKRSNMASAQPSGATSPHDRSPRVSLTVHSQAATLAPPQLTALASQDGASSNDNALQSESEDSSCQHNAASSPTLSVGSAASPTTSTSRKLPYDGTVQSFFCSTMFRQRRDATIVRGAQQKALVVMSTYPFPMLFHSILRVLCAGLFDGHSDTETLLQMAWRDANAWPRPLPGRDYPTLPFLGEVLHFVTPMYDPSDFIPAAWNVANRCTEVTVHEETALERLRNVAEGKTSSREALSEATADYLAGTTAVPHDVALWLQASGWSATTKTFDDLSLSGNSPQRPTIASATTAPQQQQSSSSSPPPVLDTYALAQLLRRRLRSSRSAAAAAGSQHVSSPLMDVPESLVSLFRQDSPRVEVVQMQNQALAALLCESDAALASILPDAASPCAREALRSYLSEVDVHAALFTHITKAWKLWELMIVGEPIAILGPSAPAVSAMALSLAAVIAPLHWTGLMRPYVTINNREIDLGIDRMPHGPTVVGATNPFFVRHLEAWPHMVCVSTDMKESTNHKMWPADSDKRQKQQFKLKNRMFCSRHYLVKTNKSWGSDVTSKVPHEHLACFIDTTLTGATTSSAIFRTFRELTEEFVAPLNAFVSVTMQQHQPYFVSDGELRRLLSHRAACEFLQQTNPPSFQRFKNAKDALEVYQAFLLSPTGQRWLQSQVRAHYRRFLLEDVTSLEDVVRITPSVADRRQTLTRLQWDLERCIDAPVMDVPLLRKLTVLCRQILPLREAMVAPLAPHYQTTVAAAAATAML